MAFIKAINAKDSIGVMNVMASNQKEPSSTIEAGRIHSLSNKGFHWDVTIQKVERDSMGFPNLARVYVLETATKDTMKWTYDSLYFYVTLEDGLWKLSSQQEYKD